MWLAVLGLLTSIEHNTDEVLSYNGYMKKKIGKTQLRLVHGDITEATTDAIVNAANSQLAHGAGVALAIATKAGEKLIDESEAAPDVPTGSVFTTTGGNLHAKYVIHAVGPVWQGGTDEAKLLSSCITEALQEADRLKLTSISFPAISTGIYGYPLNLAALTILDAIQAYLKKNTNLQLVQVVLFSREDFMTFSDILHDVISLG